MKKIIRRIVLIVIIVLLIELVFYLFKNKHIIKYKIKNDKAEFAITETYQNNEYYFEIETNNNKFFVNYENEFHKSKKVLEKIEYYKKDDLMCIYPILKNNKYINIICLKDGKQYYYDYIKDDVNDFSKVLQKKGYKVASEESVVKKIGTTKVYQENIDEKTFIYVWKYNGFYALSKKSLNQLNTFSNDTYLNTQGIQVGKYYLIPNYDELYDYDSFYIYNMQNNKIKTLKLKEEISKDYYINGIVKDKVYIFDKDNLIQYAINPKRNNYEPVGTKDDGGLFYDGIWNNINIYDLKTKELQFSNNDIPKELSNYDKVLNYKTNYYYFSENKLIVYNSFLKSEMYLLEVGNVFDPKIVDNDLYFIKGDTLYYYNIYKGLKEIMVYGEFSFNKVNRYAVYKK